MRIFVINSVSTKTKPYLSPHKNVEYGGRNVTYDDIPTDVEKLIISVPGAQVQGRLISVEVTNDLIKGYPLHSI